MFRKVLIANRGEIALRIIRACRELGVQTVAVHSEADATSLPARFADERICIGPADPAKSYRNIPNILSAAEIAGADAVHPGYGFLAENSHFADVCESAGLKFIGPLPECISLMGDKAKARDLMAKNGVPIIPGSEGVISDENEGIDVARKIGYPIIIKAVAGGGGRGMREVHEETSFLAAFHAAKSEAESAFGNGDVYVEKFFIEPRHIEIQILADDKGKMIYLPERDCSIQRRHQKLVEETPSPVVDDRLRRELGRAALAAVTASHYVNAGTVEFLLDRDHNFYFIEMNTRIQVEHPISECVTGIDLVKEQIRIAAGKPLSFKQSQVKLNGHSIECRVNAESPETFTPCPGAITAFHLPGGPGIRVDSASYMGSVITPYYDSLIAKLIVHSSTREGAIAKMNGALSEFVIEGIETSLPLHKRIFKDLNFLKGRYSTTFLDHFLASPKT